MSEGGGRGWGRGERGSRGGRGRGERGRNHRRGRGGGRGRGEIHQNDGQRWDQSQQGFHNERRYGRGGRGGYTEGNRGEMEDRQRVLQETRDRGSYKGGRGEMEEERQRVLQETRDMLARLGGGRDNRNNLFQEIEKKNSGGNDKQRYTEGDEANEETDLRGRLTRQLTVGDTECLVCLDRVRQQQSTWDCHHCYQVFHLNCIKKWSGSTTITDTASGGRPGWRCPGCQTVTTQVPKDYKCFCRKIRNPEWKRNEGLVPHSCGEVCSRQHDCPHKCLDLCHPGPCTPCNSTLAVTCPCGKLSRRIKCGDDLVCESQCDKRLGCGNHICPSPCHTGDCEPCTVTTDQTCHCDQQTRQVPCGGDLTQSFSCDQPCPNKLQCGHHQCSAPCHPGECGSCPQSPDLISTCPCGKTTILSMGQIRDSCLDPVPICDQTCGKRLPCGLPSSPHLCPTPCHTGPCPTCPLTTMVRCRCGHMDQELPCSQLTTRADDARCTKLCITKRSCGRHKCGVTCCIQLDHPCTLVCGRLLPCGSHRCDETCHRANKCPSCPHVSFDELTCHCGESITYPPVPCGTRPPLCERICSRDHPCGHPINHLCHSDPQGCPPCTTLTTKLCYGGHEQRRNIACLVEGISCGRPCGQDLTDCNHTCIKTCHPSPCLNEGDTCVQPCNISRSTCGHPCGVTCHQGPCPDTPCTTKISVTCDCGRRKALIPCADNSAYSRVTTALLATRLEEGQSDGQVNLTELARKDRKLECSDECLAHERNSRLAEALNINNPELSSKVIPRFSDLLKEWARKDPSFCSTIHRQLTELVTLAKESRQKSRALSFPCMNRDKRQFVHEYAAHFGCSTQSYDQEPKRNVVAVAERLKACTPSTSLTEAVNSARLLKAPSQVSLSVGGVGGLVALGVKPKPQQSSQQTEDIDWFG